jgi:membrane protease YdiL (CAAX protease family)
MAAGYDNDSTGEGVADGPAAIVAGPGAGASTPDGLPSRRLLRDEVWIVLALTFLASAVFAALDLLSQPTLEGTSTVLLEVPEDNLALVRELVQTAFAVVPILLVVYLLHRSGETAADIGLAVRPRDRLRRDVLHGLGLFALVGAVGLAWYAAAVGLGVNRNVVVISGEGPWWTVPIWLVNSLRFAVTEEVIVVGYLLRRLDQLGWSPNRALATSALLRGSYHLYQGWGGFFGNLAMGVLFGRIYQRTSKTVPLIVAHFLIDATAGLGYLALRDHVGWLARS